MNVATTIRGDFRSILCLDYKRFDRLNVHHILFAIHNMLWHRTVDYNVGISSSMIECLRVILGSETILRVTARVNSTSSPSPTWRERQDLHVLLWRRCIPIIWFNPLFLLTISAFSWVVPGAATIMTPRSLLASIIFLVTLYFLQQLS